LGALKYHGVRHEHGEAGCTHAKKPTDIQGSARHPEIARAALVGMRRHYWKMQEKWG